MNGPTTSVFRIAARGLEAQRVALAVATENIANASTTRTVDGGPYRVQRALHERPDPDATRFARLLDDVSLPLITSGDRHMSRPHLSTSPIRGVDGPTTTVETVDDRLRTEYDPTHPHADGAGFVTYPDVNIVEEMAVLISANRIYEANLTAVQSAKEILKRTLEI